MPFARLGYRSELHVSKLQITSTCKVAILAIHVKPNQWILLHFLPIPRRKKMTDRIISRMPKGFFFRPVVPEI
jgi:hypothetical protein